MRLVLFSSEFQRNEHNRYIEERDRAMFNAIFMPEPVVIGNRIPIVNPPLVINYDHLLDCATKRYGDLSPKDAIAKLLVEYDQGALSIIDEPVFDEVACRVCGCTENRACFHPDHGACWWVEYDLCSHCANGWNNQVI